MGSGLLAKTGPEHPRIDPETGHERDSGRIDIGLDPDLHQVDVQVPMSPELVVEADLPTPTLYLSTVKAPSPGLTAWNRA